MAAAQQHPDMAAAMLSRKYSLLLACYPVLVESKLVVVVQSGGPPLMVIPRTARCSSTATLGLSVPQRPLPPRARRRTSQRPGGALDLLLHLPLAQSGHLGESQRPSPSRTRRRTTPAVGAARRNPPPPLGAAQPSEREGRSTHAKAGVSGKAADGERICSGKKLAGNPGCRAGCISEAYGESLGCSFLLLLFIFT